jgi:carbon dioxide concentrating mechanism protein CcmN
VLYTLTFHSLLMDMSLPPVQPVSRSEFYVNGDVTIHESAVVAPGAILRAAPNSQIIIGAGACVGMGTILSAYQGVIAVGAGAILGAGVLIVGQGEIGDNACIGSTTTIYNASIEAMTVIPSGSLIGDTSRQIMIEVAVTEEREAIEEIANDPWEIPPPAPPPIQPEPQTEISTTNEPPKQPVVGQVYINQLLVTLFPERRYFNGTNNNSS